MANRRMSRLWTWTLNNYTGEEVEAIGTTTLRYVVYGYEVGEEEHTPHLQGYLESAKPLAMSTLKKLPGFARIHCEPKSKHSTRDQCRDYCRKGEQTKAEWDAHGREGANWGVNARVVEYGNWELGGAGRRNDTRKVGRDPVYDGWYETLRESQDLYDFAGQHPEAIFRYPAGVRMAVEMIKQENLNALMAEKFKDFQPRPWQAELLAELETPPHPRKVIWYVDTQGNSGKTYLSQYILTLGNAGYYIGGKSADIAHQCNGERIALFDYSRSLDEHVNYQVIECVKNGLIVSPKYDSRLKQFPQPHVVCFSNFHPDRSKLSQDRWDIRYLDTPIPVPYPSPFDIQQSATSEISSTDESTETPDSVLPGDRWPQYANSPTYMLGGQDNVSPIPYQDNIGGEEEVGKEGNTDLLLTQQFTPEELDELASMC